MIAGRLPLVAAIAVSLALGLTAWRARTAAVGGSDSACYALMTRAYVEGRWQPESPLALTAPWPDATRVAAPGGFLPSAARPGAAVPVCTPGYSLLVAPLAAVAGLDAVHHVPPLAAAMLAWLTFVMTRRLAPAWAGVGAALLVATSPVVLFMAVQPMNDITTGAVWTGVAAMLLAGRPLATGLLIGVGLLIRPNLAPAAVVGVVGLGVMAVPGAAAGRLARVWRTMTVASLAAAPGVIAVLALNWSLYGSPAQSGYGSLDVLFAWAHVPDNVWRYGRTWVTTSTPVVALALVAPFLVAPAARRGAWVVAALAAGLSVVYLAYRPFPEWWYLRFLLPAVVLGHVLAVSALAAIAARLGGRVPRFVAAAVVLGMAVTGVRRPETAEAFGLARLEARFALTSRVVRERLPARAVLVTGWDSGAVRFQPGVEVVMWDALDPAWLDRAIDWLRSNGRAPVIVLEAWEAEAFRARFAGAIHGGLDWPPRFDLDRRVQIYLPEDRARYLAGETIATERVFAARPGDRAARHGPL